MSEVTTTNIILITSPYDDGINQINQWLKEKNRMQLVNQSRFSSGDKGFEAWIYLAAYNNFDVDSFVFFVKKAKWAHPDCVQLFIKNEYDYIFLDAGKK